MLPPTRTSRPASRSMARRSTAGRETPGVSAPAAEGVPGVILDASLHHLGDDRTPEWSEASAEPEGVKLELRFAGSRG